MVETKTAHSTRIDPTGPTDYITMHIEVGYTLQLLEQDFSITRWVFPWNPIKILVWLDRLAPPCTFSIKVVSDCTLVATETILSHQLFVQV